MGEDQLNGGNSKRETGQRAEEQAIQQIIFIIRKGDIFFTLCQTF